MKYQIPKGLFDILPYETTEKWRLTHCWHFLEEAIRTITKDYSFKEIRTPIFERAELFDRGVGETSDIVTKEMYVFKDKGDRSMALRPEGTASVMRAFIEKNLQSFGRTHKLFYIGPMFRYERPQAGRYRQHHQFGVEAIGISSYEQDAEVIDLLWEFYKRLGLKNLTLMINSVGDSASRKQFKEALQTFLKPHFEALSKDSQVRFEKNPLRILDSKDPNDKEILKSAPSILDHLSDEAEKDFDQLCAMLKSLRIPFQINSKLVRGLDYYQKTVFEVTSNELGSQDSIGGGGRYDGLIANLGGQDLPGVGFAVGLERILQTMLAQEVSFGSTASPFLFAIPLGEEARAFCMSLVTQLRHKNIPAEIDLAAKKIPQSLQRASGVNARYSLIIGSDELKKRKAQCKDMQNREQEEFSFEHLAEHLEQLWKKNNV